MCLRAERGVRIADKTALKMMREMGIRCGIRRETDYHRYNSYRGKVGKTFENVIGRDFAADGPWEKMGTDVTEFKQPWGKAYFAPVYDFGSKEIVAWSTSLHPDMAQQHELLDQIVSKKPEGSRPILHSDSKNDISRFCGNRNGAVSCKPGPRRSILTRTPIDWSASVAWPAQRSTPCHSPDMSAARGGSDRGPRLPGP